MMRSAMGGGVNAQRQATGGGVPREVSKVLVGAQSVSREGPKGADGRANPAGRGGTPAGLLDRHDSLASQSGRQQRDLVSGSVVGRDYPKLIPRTRIGSPAKESPSGLEAKEEEVPPNPNGGSRGLRGGNRRWAPSKEGYPRDAVCREAGSLGG